MTQLERLSEPLAPEFSSTRKGVLSMEISLEEGTYHKRIPWSWYPYPKIHLAQLC